MGSVIILAGESAFSVGAAYRVRRDRVDRADCLFRHIEVEQTKLGFYKSSLG
jgi:hypothetical protein